MQAAVAEHVRVVVGHRRIERADVEIDVVSCRRHNLKNAILRGVERLASRLRRLERAAVERDAPARIVVAHETLGLQQGAGTEHDLVHQRFPVAAVCGAVLAHGSIVGRRHGRVLDRQPAPHRLTRACVAAQLDVAANGDVYAVGDDKRAVAAVPAHAQVAGRLERAAAGDRHDGHVSVFALHAVGTALLVCRGARERNCGARRVRVVAGEVERAGAGNREREVVEPRAVERKRPPLPDKPKWMFTGDVGRMRDCAMYFAVPAPCRRGDLVGRIRRCHAEEVKAFVNRQMHGVDRTFRRGVGGILVRDL